MREWEIGERLRGGGRLTVFQTVVLEWVCVRSVW
jgi:hypothetical protein